MAEFMILPFSRAAKPFIGVREDAAATGAVRYIDGTQCNRQHSPTIRLTSNRQCVSCRDYSIVQRKIFDKMPRATGFSIDLFVREEPVYLGMRPQARKAEAKYYVSERWPCQYGHTPSIRLVSNGGCIACNKEWRAENAEAIRVQRKGFWEENRERLCEALRARYAANPEPYKAAAKKNAAENPERKRATDKAWRESHSEYLAGYYLAWARANPDKMASKAHKRRAAKLGFTEHFTPRDVQEIFILQRGRCALCCKRLKTIEARDHIIALAKGGSNDRRNIQLTHKSCNSKKGARDQMEFMRSEFGKLL